LDYCIELVWVESTLGHLVALLALGDVRQCFGRVRTVNHLHCAGLIFRHD
jgi:hypothetical protein